MWYRLTGYFNNNKINGFDKTQGTFPVMINNNICIQYISNWQFQKNRLNDSVVTFPIVFTETQYSEIDSLPEIFNEALFSIIYYFDSV